MMVPVSLFHVWLMIERGLIYLAMIDAVAMYDDNLQELQDSRTKMNEQTAETVKRLREAMQAPERGQRQYEGAGRTPQSNGEYKPGRTTEGW